MTRIIPCGQPLLTRRSAARCVKFSGGPPIRRFRYAPDNALVRIRMLGAVTLIDRISQALTNGPPTW